MLSWLKNSSYISLLCMFFLIFYTGCNSLSKQDDLFVQIKEEVYSNIGIHSDKSVNVIIITDKDCSPCFEKYRSFKNNEQIKSIGIYFSDYPSDFLQRLVNVNKQIDWVPLKNKKILFLLNDWDKNGHGPYTFLLKNDELTTSN